MKHMYGEFTTNQINETKRKLRTKIFFMILYVDPETRDEHTNVNVNDAFESLLTEIGGMNEILFCPSELVEVMSLLKAAQNEYNKPDFNTDDFRHCMYRKLILDSGSMVSQIKEV